VHSFAAAPTKPENVLATCDYDGRTLTAAVIRDNITGVQFHPEKSGPVGQKILRTFIGMAAA
jgi:glutamine amidotransferase